MNTMSTSGGGAGTAGGSAGGNVQRRKTVPAGSEEVCFFAECGNKATKRNYKS